MKESFESFLNWAHEREQERIRKAGKHTCVPVKAGACRRMTGRGDKILKRPVIIFQLYECKICGRAMAEKEASRAYKTIAKAREALR